MNKYYITERRDYKRSETLLYVVEAEDRNKALVKKERTLVDKMEEPLYVSEINVQIQSEKEFLDACTNLEIEELECDQGEIVSYGEKLTEEEMLERQITIEELLQSDLFGEDL